MIAYFNSHTPHGVRPCSSARCVHGITFQLTHPTRGATGASFEKSMSKVDFNSHTPHGVRLTSQLLPYSNQCNFNSHTPHGVRRL